MTETGATETGATTTGAAATTGADAAPTADRVIPIALGGALTYATLTQGAYFARGLLPVLALVAVAGLARAVIRRRAVDRTIAVGATCLLAFALWNLVLGASSGELVGALPGAVLACTLAVTAIAVNRLSDRSRRVMGAVVVALGVAVAGSAWIGVALHIPPLALSSYELWRGASTLTYANATAAFLVITTVHTIGALPPRRLTNALVVVQLVGLLSTMSRAGALALGVALVALVVLTSDRSRLWAALPAVPAAAVTGAGLLPSAPIGSVPQPLIALICAVVGAAVLVVLPRMRPYHLILVACALLLGLVAAAVWHPATRAAAQQIGATRLSSTSAERGDLARVTAEQFWSAPLTGVGPGQLNFRYIDHTGNPVRALYTHNEYLQTAAETGVFGLVLALAWLGALAFASLRSRTPAGAAAFAVVAGFTVHSAFDFIWHIPVLPLLLTVSVIILATPQDRSPPRKERRAHEEQAQDRS